MSAAWCVRGTRLCLCVILLIATAMFVRLHVLEVRWSPVSRRDFSKQRPDPASGWEEIDMYMSTKTSNSEGQTPNSSSLHSAASSIWDGVNLADLSLETAIALDNTLDRETEREWGVGNTFHPAMTADERTQLAVLLDTFARLAAGANVTYWLYSGTLLGSVRHHGLVPWDDDADLAVYSAHRSRLREVLARDLPLEFEYLATGDRWKVWPRDSSKANPRVTWGYPFLDISFYNITGSWVVDADPGFSHKFRYRKDWVFPLTRRPFWRAWYPAPRKSREVVQVTYDMAECVSRTYSHREERWLQAVVVIPCYRLYSYYPFVHRHSLDTGQTNETLELSGSLKQWVVHGN